MSFNHQRIDHNNIVEYKLAGNLLEKSQAQPLLDEFEQIAQEGKTQLIINLEELIFLNSTGLNVLIALLTKSRNSGGETVLCSIAPKIKELLVITKLTAVFQIFDNSQQALDYYQNK